MTTHSQSIEVAAVLSNSRVLDVLKLAARVAKDGISVSAGTPGCTFLMRLENLLNDVLANIEVKSVVECARCNREHPLVIFEKMREAHVAEGLSLHHLFRSLTCGTEGRTEP